MFVQVEEKLYSYTDSGLFYHVTMILFHILLLDILSNRNAITIEK